MSGSGGRSYVEDVKRILESVKGQPGLAARLADDASIVDDVGLDSLEMMEFMLEVESRLGLQIDFDRMDFELVRSIAAFSEFLLGMKARG